MSAQPALVGRKTWLSGWGANLRAECTFSEPELPSEVAARLDLRGTIARGLGRSYGDPAINDGGQVLGLRRLDRYLAFDEATGTLRCEAGVTLAQILSDFVPRGWFPRITPGTKFVTIGGCIANDVHGKAHHAQGSFSACVDDFDVLLASGEIVRASRSENADLFWASFGGMGLLGVILRATVRLRKVETSYFRQKSIVVGDLAEMLAVLDEYDHVYPYSVATVDVVTRGARMGRGVVAFGDHACRAELPARHASEPLRVNGPPLITVPFQLPERSLNPLTLRVLNAVILASQRYKAEYGHYQGFFYPLDVLGEWYRAYGRRGFTQYQFVLPFADGMRNMRAILDTIFAAGELPFLNVLKRLGKQGQGLLSFPCEGYTFAIDFPVRRNTVDVLRRLDAMVRDVGGRIYLGKDSYLQPELFRAMYPELDRWLAIKRQYDPHNVFTSNLGRRLGLQA